MKINKALLLALLLPALALGQNFGAVSGIGPAFTISAPSNGQCLVYNSTTLTWNNGSCGAGGGGTVTSVGLTAPSWLTVSGSPVTGSGTLGLTATTGQTANQFLASPNGSTGAVSLRAIVAADVPQLTATQMPAFTGDVTTSAGSVATTIGTGIVTDTKAALFDKPPARVVATANSAITGLLTIDSVTVIDGDIVLLTAQTTGSQNGPWVAHSGSWTRPTWYPSAGTVQAFANSNLMVYNGTTQQGSSWRITTTGAITIDTTSTAWSLVFSPVNVQTFSSSGAGTWTKPAGNPQTVRVICIGGGGGGGSGAQVVLGTAVSGGGGGGGASLTQLDFPASFLGSTEAVSVGAGGTGGAVTSGVGSGNNGGAGSNTTFGTVTRLQAYGGGLGAGGASGANAGGGGGAGLNAGGGAASGATAGTGGNFGGGGGGGGVALAGSGGGTATSGAAGGGAGVSGLSATGGGGGGGLSTVAAFAGGNGSGTQGGNNTSVGGGNTGAVGGAGSGNGFSAGSGGGGGGANAAGAGGAGGAGAHGGGGGGGGAGAGAASGAGGAGGTGYIVVITYY